MRAAYFAIIAAALAGAAPADAQGGAQLDCIRAELGAEALASIETFVSAAIFADDQTPPEDAKAAIGRAAVACRDRHRWKPRAARAALDYALADINAEVADRLASARGIVSSGVKASALALTPAEIAAFRAGDQTVVERFLAGLDEKGFVKRSAQDEQADALVGYIAAMQWRRADAWRRFARPAG